MAAGIPTAAFYYRSLPLKDGHILTAYQILSLVTDIQLRRDYPGIASKPLQHQLVLEKTQGLSED